MNQRKLYYLVLAGITFLLVSLACGSSTTRELETAIVPTVTDEEVTNETPTEQITEEKPTEIPPTNTPLPTSPPPTPTPEPEPITVTKYGFGQNGMDIGFAFVVENPNQGLAVENSQYQVAAYNDAGSVVGTKSGYINILLPGQSFGIGGDLLVDEGVIVSSIEVQLNAGEFKLTEPMSTFEVESIAYYESDMFSYATGVINNPYDRDFTDVRVSAVIYDEKGNIIGGGFTYLNFILANGSTGTEVLVTSDGKVARVELFPSVANLSMLNIDEEIPTDASNIELLKYGFGQDDFSTGFGMLIENPNTDYSVEGSQYHLTVYSSDGKVLTTQGNFISILYPEQILGVGGDISFVREVEIDKIDFQIRAGEYVKSEQIPSFTSENVTYQPGSYSSKVTGLIVSPYNTDITNLRVSAIVYDENEMIVGGGFTYIDFVPANDKIAVEVLVTTAGNPSTAELYTAISSLSDLE